MILKDINPESIKKVSNPELLSLHHRIHQLYGVAKKKNLDKFKKFLTIVHSVVMGEMINRGMKHKTDILEFYLTKLIRE